MAFSTAAISVPTSATLLYTAGAAQTVRLRASTTVRIGASVLSQPVRLAPGEMMEMNLSLNDEVYGIAVARPGAGQRSPLIATVFLWAGP